MVKFAETLRMSHALAAINTGKGNAPKYTGDGQLYGSPQSTKRQIMEASGITKDTRNLRWIADECGIKYESDGADEASSSDKHSIPWDDAIAGALALKIKSGEVKTFSDIKSWAIESTKLAAGARFYGHFNAYDKQSIKIDGAYGTTGHRGLHRGQGRGADDLWVLSSTVDGNENFGDGKAIAFDEFYWSKHQFDFTKGDDQRDGLKRIMVAAAAKVLKPRANRNQCNRLSCEYSITVVSDSHTNINWPPVVLLDATSSASCSNYLQRLVCRNSGKGFKYIVYTCVGDLPQCLNIVSGQGDAADDINKFEQLIGGI